MPFENQSCLEPEIPTEAQQNQAPSVAFNGSSWGLLFLVDGQKADKSLAEIKL
jgi:hypothetical protein